MVDKKMLPPSSRMLFCRERQVSEIPRPQTADPGERRSTANTKRLKMALSCEKLSKEAKNRVTRNVVTRYHYAALAR